MSELDLVCWDFGDTLCDEMFQRISPPGVPEWTIIYEQCLAERPAWVDDWMLGGATMNDLIEPLAERLPMTAGEVARHLRAVWHQIVWFDEAMAWLRRLDGVVAQAIVTVNPWEFAGIAAATGLDQMVDVVVTSAELGTDSKSAMADKARELVGLPGGLATTLLIDNKAHNTLAFEEAGGQAILFTRETFEADAVRRLAPIDDRVSDT